MACLYLVAATDLSELSKVPALLDHYQCHLVEEPAMGFWEFMELHYESEDHHDDHEHHLPFQDCSEHVVLNLPAIFTEALSIHNPQSFVFISEEWPHWEVFLPSELAFDIWNPPQ